ncbi:hypothetical protein DL769_000617 [Monosporascus sp. CRB-8-3]|nr:hypothetical protein DL769_000617 [Monosporascus sp. CRB-8-3]
MTAVTAHQQHQSQQQQQQQQYNAYIAAQYPNQNCNPHHGQQMPPAAASSSQQPRHTSNLLPGSNANGTSSTVMPTRVVSNGTNGGTNGLNGGTYLLSQGERGSGLQRPALTNGNSQSNSRSSQTPADDDQSDTDRRPSSAPGYKNSNSLSLVTSHDDSEQNRSRRPTKPPLLRSKSEHMMRQDEAASSPEGEIHDWGARHGFEDHYQSDFVSQLAINWYMYFTDRRHETTGQPKLPNYEIEDWRMRDRLKTVSAALAVCLNIGVEPPDQLKTNPGAKLEAWTDPFVPPATKALETIGKNLQQQYENISAPTIFVWDCSEAGNILNNYHRFVEKHEEEEEASVAADPNHEKTKYRSYLHLAACSVKENLPTNPLLPADLFTACLTTPVEMALWFFVLQNPLRTNISPERAKKLPGRLQERRTPLGELNWIFTAITDTIAWTSLPRHLFPQRIMMVYGCHPQSYPELPDTHQHPLWESWDLAVDLALAQLPMLERKENEGIEYEYQSSTFFTEQLTAFEIYLMRGDAHLKKPPEQLPVVLQVLLSQQHRVRALVLLGKFLDLGPWAVQLALSIGIFPYVLKLLQSAAAELKAVMVFIWTRVLAVDISCQPDLIKDSGYNYFLSILKPSEGLPVVDSDEHKAMCAFILAMLCKGYKPGQVVCNQTDVMTYCLAHLRNDKKFLLRQWACLCISQLWQDLPEAKWRGIRENAPMKLSALAKDRCCEVRAAVVHAMTTFLGIPDLTDEVARIEESIAWTLLDMTNDGSPLVRKELLVFLSHFVLRYENKFIVSAFEQLIEEKEYSSYPPRDDGLDHRMGLHYARPDNRNPDGTIKATAHGLSHNTVFAACWKHILVLTVDPHPEVQRDATVIVDYVHNALLSSTVGSQAQSLMEDIRKRARRAQGHKKQPSTARNGIMGVTASDITAPLPSPGLFKRTASYLFPSVWGEDKPAEPARAAPSGVQRSPSQKLRSAVERTAPPEQNDQLGSHAHYHVASEPVSGGFRERNLEEEPSLPLTSTFLDWSIEYFREPQMKPSEAEEPGSTEYNERLWRRSRNDNILRETQPQKQFAGNHKWSNQLCIMNNGAQPAKMTFHQFEDHLAVADGGNTVYVWDWKKQNRLNRFSNGNPEGSRISDMKFINEDDTGFLMTGSSDGVIRIYRGYDSEKTTELASAWRALTHMVPSNVNSGMVFDWQQVTGRVLVAGDVRVIRVWAAAYETCVTDIPARSGSCVTSLTSDQMTGNIFVAGFGDGAVRVFDTRLRPQESMVRKWKDDADRQWIRNVHMQRGGQRELLSASRNGKVKLWDIRMDNPLRVIQATSDTLRTASVHEHLPVFSVGTSSHTVKVFNLDGTELSRMEPYSSFLQQNRGSPISATAFHPHRMILGCAARGDYHINLFTCASEKASDYFRSI